ncbi:DegT/DnrJ/EryC1/StrS family aminotransferase, partial [Thermosyntropha sp.]|uniref:DegT/DnrJ/EryC1/StrS family aminotransferase n=1 Tax=Thermosyntropha sp. TaxID=2740820 RepID=UPI0025E3F27D
YLGFNYRMTDIQAALGISQLNKLDWFVKRRKEIAEKYSRELKDLPLELPFTGEGYHSSYHLYTIRIKEEAEISRSELYEKLRQKGIYSQVHYIPVHTFPYYRERFGYNWGDYPAAEDWYKRVLSLPIFPGMSDEEINRVIKAVREVIK